MPTGHTRRTALLFPALAGGLLARSSRPDQVDLFRRGENGVHTYRIPALIETKKGTLLAVADARHNNDRDLPGHISIMLRRSRDKGRTWSPARVLREVSAGGVGDASFLLDPASVRIWCFHAYGPPGIGFPTARPGESTGPNTLQFHAIHSDDDGVTWSPPRDLTPQVKDPKWQAIFATSGTHFATSKGRYIVPLVVKDENGRITSRNAYSDDRGENWKTSPAIAPDTDESKAVELSDGTILQNMRNGKRRTIARSPDGVTFANSTHDEALIDPGCNAGLALYRHGKHDVLIFTNAASEKREHLSVRNSLDDGKTWSPARSLHAGPAAYSTVVPLHDGTIAVLYERGEKYAAERITFARFTADWLLLR